MKFKKIIKCLYNINYINTYLKGTSPLFELEPLIKKINKISTVIDIGSNKGQFILIIKKFFPSAKIYSFEPLKKELILQKKIIGHRNIKYFNFALGNNNNKIKIHVTSRRDSSSILKPKEDVNKIYSVTNIENIIQKKLDSLFQIKKIKKPILLKLDVQGYELNVLKGATKILKNVNYLIIEISYKSVYEKQASLKELKSFLKNQCFFPVKKTNRSFLKGKIFQEDILYKKK